MPVRENFGGPQAYHNKKTLPQDAQKIQTSHPPSPQRAKTRFIPSEGLPTPYTSL